MQGSIVVGGIPTEFDVKRIEEALGALKQGDIVTYEQLEEILTLQRASSRFRTVVSVWRRKLEREQNFMTTAIMNKGYRVCTNSERVTTLAGDYSRGIRRIGKIGTRAIKTRRDGLKPEESRLLDHTQQATAHIHQYALTEKRKLNMPDPNVKALTAQASLTES